MIAFYNKVGAAKLRRWYRDHLSNIALWDQGSHCNDYLLYPDNVSSQIAIDELSLNQGELVTIVTNRLVKGRRGKLIAIIDGTKGKDIEGVLKKLAPQKLDQVKEVTLDMAKNMNSAMKNVFSGAHLVIDRFHVIRMVQDALQHQRIKYRWQAIDDENEELDRAKRNGTKPKLTTYPNGDSLKQLLARSRYILYKTPDKWTASQKLRSDILFSLYPELKKAYYHVHRFRMIYSVKDRLEAERRIMEWMIEAPANLTDQFRSTIRSLFHYLDEILNFFNNRSTNAAAESYNAQLKAIRATQKGVSDYKMFLFRIEKLFA